MKYMRRRRNAHSEMGEDDPLSGVANLFDLGLVFIVGLLITLFSAYQLTDLFNEKSEMTLMKKSADGEWEIMIKKGKSIKAMKVTRSKSEGRGERLGTAYRLENGTVVYVPEMEE